MIKISKTNTMALNETILSHLRNEDNIYESFDTILNKAKKGLITTAMLSSILSSNAFSKNEKSMIKNAIPQDTTQSYDDKKTPIQSDIISPTTMNAIHIIKDCLNLNGPISKLNDKSFSDAIHNLNNYTDTILKDISERLSPDDIKDLQTQLRFIRGTKYYNTKTPKDVIRPTGKMDKQTILSVINLMSELKKRGITTSSTNAKTDSTITHGAFPGI